MKALFVGGRLDKELIDVEELVNLPEFSGRYTETKEEIIEGWERAKKKNRALEFLVTVAFLAKNLWGRQ